MGYQPSLSEVKQEAARLGFRCALDDGCFELDHPVDTHVYGSFQESPQGIREAWIWLQGRRLSQLQAGKIRDLSPSTPLSLRVPPGHQHEWERLRGVAGLFACREGTCLWFSVCPGCVPSMDLALRAYQGISGVEVYWCPLHERQKREEFPS